MLEDPKKLMVLLVDGNPDLLYIYKRFLTELGCEVFTAVDFTTATDQLRSLEDHDLKVVFVDDHHFRGGSEVDAELISTIRARWPRKKIVAITTDDEQAFLLQGMGKVDYVIARGPETSNLIGFQLAIQRLRRLGL